DMRLRQFPLPFLAAAGGESDRQPLHVRSDDVGNVDDGLAVGAMPDGRGDVVDRLERNRENDHLARFRELLLALRIVTARRDVMARFLEPASKCATDIAVADD